MVRAMDGQDYFVHEPALASTNANRVEPVLPMRWFLRDGEHWAKAHPLIVSDDTSNFIVNGSCCLEIPLADFKVSMQRLERSHVYHKLPAPHRLQGKQHMALYLHRLKHFTEILYDNAPAKQWDLPCPNPWRAKAAGRRVHVVPVWVYCDDTSGNVSKKWNKHNSILFTLAGLPREYVQMGYNIHFLSTSNLAPPLEQAEGFVSMLR